MLKRLAIGIVVKILDPKIPRVGGGGHSASLRVKYGIPANFGKRNFNCLETACGGGR